MTKETKQPGWEDDPRTARLEAEVARVRAREEKRLITIARKAGLFDVRLSNTELREMIQATILDLKPGLSTLSKLEAKRARAALARRKTDARRKALLGGFLVAQCRHKPDLHEKIVPDLRSFLLDHTNAGVALRNHALLQGFLTDPNKMDIETPNLPTSEHRQRAHRQILLGTWLLDRRETNPDVADLIDRELDGFLRESGNSERNRKLLADLLSE